VESHRKINGRQSIVLVPCHYGEGKKEAFRFQEGPLKAIGVIGDITAG
jgi:hypothetical protein